MDPGPGVGFGTSAGGVVRRVCLCGREGTSGLYLAKGLQVDEFRLGLVIKHFHFLSSQLNNADMVLKSQSNFVLSMQ
jgi:hypothetical protein